jgi:hypothetical protein
MLIAARSSHDFAFSLRAIARALEIDLRFRYVVFRRLESDLPRDAFDLGARRQSAAANGSIEWCDRSVG